MSTRSVVPRATGEGGIGTTLLRWATGFINAITCTTINALTLVANAVGFTITGGTTSTTLTVPATITLPNILAAGALPYGSAAGVLSSLVGGAANLRLFMNAAGTGLEWATGIKIGLTTIDTATASGDQVITGVGFKPSNVIFIVNVGGSPEMSIGFDDGASPLCFLGAGNVASDTYDSYTGFSLNLSQAASIYYRGLITTLGADGFTITWTKVGAKTGTANIFYVAFR